MSLMLTFRAGKITLLLVLVSLAAACSREQQDWRSAEAADTVEGYGQFLERHPESELATQAHTRVAQLSEDREWQRAGGSDTADAYRQFLAQHPNGKWAQEARIRIENFSLAGSPAGSSGVAASVPSERAVASEPPAMANATTAAWEPLPAPPLGATATSTSARALPGEAAVAPEAPSEAARLVPSSSTTRTASPMTATSSPGQLAPSDSSTGYGVQLGAFSSEGAATNQWQQLTGRFGSELRGLAPHVVSINTAGGALFRLQARVADETHAREICDSLKKQAQACVPVLPH
jgi:cell division septation protein DedD